MKAGLLSFGTDFGNGALDGVYFQVDDQRENYRLAKQAVSAARHQLVESEASNRLVEVVLPFMRETFEREWGEGIEASEGQSVSSQVAHLSQAVQEDFAVLHRDEGAVLVNVCFPSGWRPERLARASFQAIHAPVPGFSSQRIAESMTEAMVTRGPFVRFVWTVSADSRLDHHPDSGQRSAFDAATTRAFLRVERQVTVPFSRQSGALFLIRTHLYDIQTLSMAQRATLKHAIEIMPEEVARYKSLWTSRNDIVRLLQTV